MGDEKSKLWNYISGLVQSCWVWLVLNNYVNHSQIKPLKYYQVQKWIVVEKHKKKCKDKFPYRYYREKSTLEHVFRLEKPNYWVEVTDKLVLLLVHFVIHVLVRYQIHDHRKPDGQVKNNVGYQNTRHLDEVTCIHSAKLQHTESTKV